MSPLFLLTVLLVLLAGCRGTSELEPGPALPFHVAITPLTVRPLEPDVPPDAESLGDEDEPLLLEFDGRTLGEALAASLDGSCFSQATSLPDWKDAEWVATLPPEEQKAVVEWLAEQDPRAVAQAITKSPEGGPPGPLTDLDFDFWVHWARTRVKADVLLVGELRYEPLVTNDTNDLFWPNIGLFFLGGPFSWFVNDRDYFYVATLQFSFFDMSFVDEGEDLRHRRFELLASEKSSRETTLDFVDRADGRVGFYALSIIWPASLLARETDGVRNHLQEQIVSHLAAELASETRRRADGELLRASRLVHFYPEGLRVEESEAGIMLLGTVVLERVRDVDRLHGYEVWLRDGLIAKGDFEAADPTLVAGSRLRDDTLRYELRVPLGEELPIGLVQLRIVESELPQRVRSFSVSPVVSEGRP